MNMTLSAENAELRELVEDLRAENKSLREALTPKGHPLRHAFGLTISEDRIVTHLARGGWYSRSQLITAIGNEVYGERNIDSLIKRIRRKIGGAFKITAAYGIGYGLEGENLTAVRKIIASSERTTKEAVAYEQQSRESL